MIPTGAIEVATVRIPTTMITSLMEEGLFRMYFLTRVLFVGIVDITGEHLGAPLT
jgi:hypothetical protein